MVESWFTYLCDPKVAFSGIGAAVAATGFYVRSYVNTRFAEHEKVEQKDHAKISVALAVHTSRMDAMEAAVRSVDENMDRVHDDIQLLLKKALEHRRED